jgi:ADP-heptose:LPS heptosyltransferase
MVTGRVLLLRALGLGDFLTGVPAYRAVRRAFPGHRVILAAPGMFAALAPLTGAVDEVLPTGELQAIGWAGEPPAVGIDLHGRGPASHRIVAALGPRHLIAFGGSGGFTGPVWRAREHERDRWCRLCSESGIPADPADLLLARQPIPTGDVPGEAGAALVSAGDREREVQPTVLHPGAAASSRRWPARRFAAVARALSADGHHVLITGSAAEWDLASRVANLAGLPADRVRAGRTPLAVLAALVASAHVIICGDTGMSHLASAYARPSVTLFGPVPPSEWGPPTHPRHQVLWAAPHGYRGDPHARWTDPALAAVSTGEVLHAVHAALAGKATAAPGRLGQQA